MLVGVIAENPSLLSSQPAIHRVSFLKLITQVDFACEENIKQNNSYL